MELPGGLKLDQKLVLAREDGTTQECEVVGGGWMKNPTTNVLEEHAFVKYTDKGVTFVDKVNLDKLAVEQ